jgi:hypothetical protein
MTPQLERLTVLCKQLNLLHLPTQIAHLGQMAAKRELAQRSSMADCRSVPREL